MKFSLKLVNGKGCRLGLLSGVRSNPELIYKTPLSLAITERGSIPHLTKDVYHNFFSKNSILCIPVGCFAGEVDVLQSFKKGVAKFAALPTHPVCVVVQDPTKSTQSGYNTNSCISVWNSRGRIKLSSQKYIDVVRAIRPDWYEALNDADTSHEASKKRMEKSKRNSSKFLEQCLELHRSEEDLKDVGIFAPLLGGQNPIHRSKWSEDICKEDVDGYSLLGLHLNGPSAETLEPIHLNNCVKASLEKIPASKARQAQGAFSPLSLLELVECGVDIFDSSLAYLATERGRALCFPCTLDSIPREERVPDTLKLSHSNLEDLHLQSTEGPSIEEQKNQFGNKKIRINCSDETQQTSSIPAFVHHSKTNDDDQNVQKEAANYYEIDLKDKRYMERKEPLLKECKCYTCSTFSTAYIHHLLTVREMLASVLLMIHNLHHWDLFFATIRRAIEEDRFEQFKKFFTDFKNGKMKKL